MPLPSLATDQRIFAFGPFLLRADERLLMRDGYAVRIGGRALDILIALINRCGEVVPKDELVALIWPNLLIDDSAVRVHISQLRKTLGDGDNQTRFIANVPGRGYSFVAPVSRGGPEGLASADNNMSGNRLPARIPPAPLTRVIGRGKTIDTLADLLLEKRLVTILGPGGIGKTTLAIAVVEAAGMGNEWEAIFVELSPIDDPALITAALASALGTAIRTESPIDDITAAIADRRLLIVLDGCEHLIEAAARLVEVLLRAAPAIRVLATSRESLRVAGEWVHNLAPLDFPEETSPISPQDAIGYSAIELFTERAASLLGGFTLTDENVRYVTEICRQLDGIALAIELATGRLDSLSIAQLANALQDCFTILTRGRRTALPRHQTLRGTLDWSYRLLPLEEQQMWRRLGVFNNWFSLEDVRAITAVTSSSPVATLIPNLVAKSLISADLSNCSGRYRLLSTSRAYALEKLAESGEGDTIHRRHAEHYAALFVRADQQWESRPTSEWIETYAGQLDNLRAAVDWAFSPSGEGTLGVALTVAAVPLWFQLSLIDECLSRVRRALTWLDSHSQPDLRSRMRLTAALGWPQMHAMSDVPSGADAWRATLALAEQVGDQDYQLRALWALWVDLGNQGKATEALAMAERFAVLARSTGDRQDEQIAHRLRSWSLLNLGRLSESYQIITEVIANYCPPPLRSHLARFQFDQCLIARITLSRSLWLLGRFDEALSEIREMIADGIAREHKPSLAHLLTDAACFLALWAGDLPLAEQYSSLLKHYTTSHSLDVWRTYADIFDGEILVQRGQVNLGLALIRRGMESLRTSGFVQYHTCLQGMLASALLKSGSTKAAWAEIRDAEARNRLTGEAWHLPEILRLKGLALAVENDPDAEQSLRAALDLAREQGALFWELRAATSLAELWRVTQPQAAMDLLGDILARCSQGDTIPDRMRAEALHANLVASVNPPDKRNAHSDRKGRANRIR